MLQRKDLVFIDDYLVGVNKPAGLLVHPSRLARQESETLMKQLRDLLGQWVFPIHRLDRPTSGIIVFALNSQIASELGAAFARREVKKQYIALVRGYTEPTGEINRPLKEIWDKMTDKLARKNKDAQEAITQYKTLEQVEVPFAVRPHPTARYSLVMASPLTGRQRQIRRHFKSIFHPLIGDAKHGDNAHNKMLRRLFGLQRLMLHAFSLSFKHPVSGKEMLLHAPAPIGFTQVIEKLGFSDSALPTKEFIGTL